MEVKCAHTEVVDIDLLVPHPRNPNKHSEKQIKYLAKIMKHQGWRHPITVSNRSGFIVAGHGRLLAAKANGWTKAPVDRQDFDTEADEYAHLVADNKIAELADLDLSMVNEDILSLGPDFDLELLGMPDFVLEPAEKFEPQADEDSVPENVDTRCKPGDIWQLGRHRLMCGDSTNIQHVEKLMNGEKADMVFTDPPYGVNYDGGHAEPGVRREKLANDDSTKIYDDSVPLMVSFSKDTAPLYLWFAATKSLQVLQVLQQNNYEIRSWLIWNKNMAQFGAIGAQYKQKHEPCLYCFKKGNTPYWCGPNNEVSVWDVDRASKNEFHPTQKPVELSKRAIGNSCPAGGIVLDLFGGSGSTLIGCEATGRCARLMELSPNYCDVILGRWEKYTGQTAELITEGESNAQPA